MKKYMYNRKLITYNCDNCRKECQKPQSEYDRNIKLSRKNYCSRQCAAMAANNLRFTSSDKKYDISKHANNKLDEFSKFRQIYRSCIKRFQEVNITLEDLKNQWNTQNGICVYSKVTLDFNSLSKLYKPSLDRIDSSKGYIKGNIQFTSIAINYMKSSMSDSETVELCKIISNNYNVLQSIGGPVGIREPSL